MLIVVKPRETNEKDVNNGSVQKGLENLVHVVGTSSSLINVHVYPYIFFCERTCVLACNEPRALNELLSMALRTLKFLISKSRKSIELLLPYSCIVQ